MEVSLAASMDTKLVIKAVSWKVWSDATDAFISHSLQESFEQLFSITTTAALQMKLGDPAQWFATVEALLDKQVNVVAAVQEKDFSILEFT